MKKILILVLFISGSALAQQIPDYGFDKIRIAGADMTIQAYLKPVKKDPELQPDRFYYWYSGNSIHSTQGGFSGRLLNGQYTEYYLDKNLKEQGDFKNGLKEGVWKSWNDNGTIIELYTWEKGVKIGVFSLYDDHGNLKQTGAYRNNLLEGEVKTYSGNNAPIIVTYHNGNTVTTKPVSFWAKVNIFKKGDKANKIPAKPLPAKNK